MKKKAPFIKAAALTSAIFFGAISYGSGHASGAGAVQEATGRPGKGEHAMERVQNSVLRKIEFENNRVVVVRYRFGPRAKIPMHAAPDLVAIWLSDARLKLTFPDGTSRVEDRKAGDVEWEPAQRHSGENLADAPLDFISVQLKVGHGH